MDTLYAMLVLCCPDVGDSVELSDEHLDHVVRWAVEWELLGPEQGHRLRLAIEKYDHDPVRAAWICSIIRSNLRENAGRPYIGHDLPHPAPWLLKQNAESIKNKIAYLEGQTSMGGYLAEEAAPLLARAKADLTLYELAAAFMDDNLNIHSRRYSLNEFKKIVGPTYRNGVMPPSG